MMITYYSLVCSLSKKEAIPAVVGFKARRRCCGLRQPVRGKSSFPWFFGGGSVGISLPPQAPNLQDWFPGSGSSIATSEAPPALHGEVGSGDPDGSQGSPCPPPCQPAQGPELVPIHRFSDIAISLGIQRRANFKMSCKLNDLFPSSSITLYIFCSFFSAFYTFCSSLCSCAYLSLFF